DVRSPLDGGAGTGDAAVAARNHRRPEDPRAQGRSRTAGIPPTAEGAGPSDRLYDAAGGGAGFLFRNHYGRRADAVPAPETGIGGKRLRLDSPFHVPHGPRL